MNHAVKQSLSEELDKLKVLTEFGQDLKVVWSPSRQFKLSGEVRGNTVYVYEEDPAKALDTLRHEFVDYVISGAIKPYEKVTVLYSAMINALVEKLSEEAYLEKEKVVDSLMKIIQTNTHGACVGMLHAESPNHKVVE